MLSNKPADCHERREQPPVRELDQSPFHYLGHKLGLTHWVKCRFFYPLLRAISKIQINLLQNGRGDVLSCELLCKHSHCVKDLFKSIPEKNKTYSRQKNQSPYANGAGP